MKLSFTVSDLDFNNGNRHGRKCLGSFKFRQTATHNLYCSIGSSLEYHS